MALHFIASWVLAISHPKSPTRYQTSYRVSTVKLVDGVYVCTERTLNAR